MSAARKPTSPPDVSGATDEWKRLLAAREAAEEKAGHSESDKQPDADEDQEQPAADESKPAAKPGPKSRPSVRSRRGAPVAAEAVAMTVRVDPDEALDINRFVLDLADAAERRQLDKAEVIRELLRQAMEHDPTRRALIRRLK